MAYVSLYRKYRPQTFDEILGQSHVSTTLANAIKEDRVAHAYLFTGPRGTGKTSTARILAKALNCERGPTPSPCGVCDSCVSIASGSSMDVIEMDAASHSKVDETREILAGVSLAASGGRKKVYVIDEVHMLTPGSFNALLKTLEEPPPHVVFILATTDAHKVLETIVSRTQRFDFRRVPVESLEAHLAAVAKLEDIDSDPEVFGIIARHSDGSVRDALSTLDQLSSIAGRISGQDAERILGDRREDTFIGLFDAIASGDLATILTTVHSLVASGADVRQLALGALGHARSLLLVRSAPQAEGLLDFPERDMPSLLAQADRFAPGVLVRILELLGTAITDMRAAPNHRLLFEVALVRAAAPETDPSATGLLGRIERLERRIGIDDQAPGRVVSAETTTPRGQTGSRTSSGNSERRAPEPVPPAAGAGRAVTQAAARVEERQPVVAAGAPDATGSDATPTTAPAAAIPAGVGFSEIRDTWSATMQEVGKVSKRVWGMLNPSRPVSLEGDTLVIEVQSPFHESSMSEELHRKLVSDALHAALGVRPSLVFRAKSSAPAREPADDIADLAGASPLEAREDPIELVKKGFGAQVVEEKPIR